MKKSTLLIGGHRKSGTTVLHSLFDGHEELYVPPHDLNILYGFYPGWTKSDISRKDQEARLLKTTIESWQSCYEQGSNRAKRFNILQDEIKKNLPQINLNEPGEVFDLVISALWKTAPQNVKILVVKETSTEIHVPWLFEDRNTMKFLHLVRDPRDNYAALAAGQHNYYAKLGDDALDTLSSTIFRYKLGIQFLRWNNKRFGERQYQVLRFEDLVKKPIVAMENIANWLGINWTDTLINPTRNGVPYKGNSHEGIKFSGISAENVGKWSQRISQDEAAVIEHVLSEEMTMNGYERTLDKAYSARCAGHWYGQMNFKYFFSDPFKQK